MFPECETLDPTWSKVGTEPALPVDGGVEITLICPAAYVNNGGNKATCVNGRLVLVTTEPLCAHMVFGK